MRFHLTTIQKGVLFHSLSGFQKSTTYISQAILTLNEGIDVGKFWSAWGLLIKKHPILHSVLNEDVDGGFYFEAIQNLEANKTFSDLSKFDKLNQNKMFFSLVEEEKSKGFNLFKEPLIRCHLVKFSENQFKLICCYHHIIMCAFSAMRALTDLFEFYGLLVAGKNFQLNVIKNYNDFLMSLPSADDSSYQYWKQLLSGVSNPTPLPYKKSVYESTLKSSIARYAFNVKEKNLLVLKKIAKKERITLNILLQGLWGLLLAKYTNLPDVVFGVVRSFPETLVQGQLGLFINTLPVRVALDSKKNNLRALCQALKIQNKEMKKNMFASLVDIKKQTAVLENNLFSSVFEFKQKTLIDELRALDSNWDRRDLSFSTDNNYQLTLEVFGNLRELSVVINYDNTLFSTKDIIQVASDLRALIFGIEENFEKDFAYLELKSQKRALSLLTKLNQTEQPRFTTINIIEAFKKSVNQFPNNLAVQFKAVKLTYLELYERVQQFASELLERNISSGDIVGLCCYRSENLVISILAIWMVGAVYLPIDSAQPERRLLNMLKEADVDLIITDNRIRGSLENFGNILSFNDIFFKIQKEVNCISALEQRAYIIYTSGSAGAPKGVVVRHTGLYNVLFDVLSKVQCSQKDVFLAVTSYTFDISLVELVGPLLFGAKVVIVPDESVRNPEALVDLVRMEKPTIIQATPTMLQMVVETQNDVFENMQILSGGEELHINLARELYSRSQSLWNLYGPTEATIWSMAEKVSNKPKNQVSIGAPLANTKIFLLDQYNMLPPFGVPGELFILGSGLAEGYLKDLKKTKSSFLPCPFDKSALMYATGDYAVLMSNGIIKYMGRQDGQVKLRGHRLELLEVEHYINKIPSVQQAVIKLEHVNGDKKLVAFIKLSKKNYDEEVESDKIKTTLRKSLPAIMVPGFIVFMKDWPKLPSGKINKKSLSVLIQHDVENRFRGFNLVESKIRQIWGDLLGEIPKDKSANFFDLGGHSLLVMQLMGKLKKEFDVEVTIQELFEYVTIQDQANFLCEKKAASINEKNSKVGNFRSKASLPSVPTSVQQAILFQSEFESGGASNISIFLSFEGEAFDIGWFKECLHVLIMKYPILRSFYKNTDGFYSVTFAKPEDMKFTVSEDRSSLGHLDQMVSDFINIPFDLDKFPLFRVKIIDTGERKLKILFVFHHVIVDGGAILHFILNLFERYAQKNLSDNVVCLEDYSYFSQPLENEQDRLFWKEKLADVQLFTKLRKTDDQNSVVGRNEVDTVFLNKMEIPLVGLYANKEKITEAMLFFSVFAIIFSRFVNSDSVAIGYVVSTEQSDDENILQGPNINVLPIVLNVGLEKTFQNFLAKIKKQLLEAMTHQKLLYHDMLKLANLGKNNRLNVGFVLHSFPFFCKQFSDFSLKVENFSSQQSQFDFLIDIFPDSEGYRIKLNCKSDIVSLDGLNDFVQEFRNTLLNILNCTSEFQLKSLLHDRLKDECDDGDLSSLHQDKLPLNLEVVSKLKIIWAELLNVKTFSLLDDFFNVGGHSLLLMKLVDRVKKVFSIDLSLRELFEHSVISDMSKLIESKVKSLDGPDLIRVEELKENKALRYEPFELTEVQQAYWLGRNGYYELGNVATFIYGEWLVDSSSIDLKKLEETFNELILRHDALRIIILETGQQTVLENVDYYQIRIDRFLSEKDFLSKREKCSHRSLSPCQWPLFEISISLV